MDKNLFFYELEGRGYTFQNKNWDEAKHGFEDDMLNMAWEMWSSGQVVKAQAVPESNALLSAAVDAVKKLGSGDFVLVPKDQFESLNEFKDLYKRAIINAKKRKDQINWAHVAGLGVGSGRAVELCKTLNIDPSATNMYVMIEAQEQKG